jgi:hypothetical protein
MSRNFLLPQVYRKHVTTILHSAGVSLKSWIKPTVPIIAAVLSIVSSSSAVPAQTCSTKGGCPYKNQREAIDTLLAQESQHKWKNIQWRTDAAQSLIEAQAQSKPIFVFFVVKQLKPSPSKWSSQKDDTGKT